MYSSNLIFFNCNCYPIKPWTLNKHLLLSCSLHTRRLALLILSGLFIKVFPH